MTPALETTHPPHTSAVLSASTHGPDWTPEQVRADFPVLAQSFQGRPLIYLDNGATTQKPHAVIDRITNFYQTQYGTVRRGVYALSVGSTAQYDAARERVKTFINAPQSESVIFTKGTTEAINLVATSYGNTFVKAGDEIIISALEHHANIVPWQQLCKRHGATLKVIPINDAGEIQLDAYASLLTDKTRMVAVNHVSNTLGTINPVKQMIEMAHQRGVPVLIDGAQAAPHMAVDVQALDCDFYCFSGHKVYGPTGVGVLYGKSNWLEAMEPYQFGGDMIDRVTFEETTFADLPHKFEAGTPPIAEVIGLDAAIEYISSLGMDRIAQVEQELLEYATEQLLAIDGLTIIGTAKEKASLISFVMADAHPLDIGTICDQKGVAIRTGHHCTQPLMDRFGVSATARASFAFYNTKTDVDALVQALRKVQELFS